MPRNFKDRKAAWIAYRSEHRLLERYPDRRHGAEQKKTEQDHILEDIKNAFIAGWKQRDQKDDQQDTTSG